MFDDADVAAAAEAIAVRRLLQRLGQDCTAATRVLAGPGVHNDLVDALAEQARGQTVGGPDVRGRRLRAAEQRRPSWRGSPGS